MRVILMPRDRATGMSGFGGNAGMVKEDRTFEIGGVSPGSYYVVAIAGQGAMTVNGKAPVDVAREDVDNVALPLHGGVTLRGAIRLDGSAQQLEQA